LTPLYKVGYTLRQWILPRLLTETPCWRAEAAVAQRHAHSVPSFPTFADDLHIRRLEGVEAGERITVGWDGEDLIALALGQKLMFAFRHADFCPQKIMWGYGHN
jgi:hypothetical protein